MGHRQLLAAVLSILFVLCSAAASVANEQETTTVVQTGVVEYEVSGESLTRYRGREIVEVARETEFSADGSLVRESEEGQTIEYVPARYDGADPIAEALAEGLLVYKFTVRGEAPSDREYPPGTYYVWLDFVDGRWRAATIDETGRIMCAAFGVRVTREIYPGAKHPHEAREISIHQHGSSALGATDWVLSPAGEWYPIGCCSCTRAVICSPI